MNPWTGYQIGLSSTIEQRLSFEHVAFRLVPQSVGVLVAFDSWFHLPVSAATFNKETTPKMWGESLGFYLRHVYIVSEIALTISCLVPRLRITWEKVNIGGLTSHKLHKSATDDWRQCEETLSGIFTDMVSSWRRYQYSRPSTNSEETSWLRLNRCLCVRRPPKLLRESVCIGFNLKPTANRKDIVFWLELMR